MTKILRRRKRGQTGTHADRHCEERARMLVSEFVIGQCVSRPTSWGLQYCRTTGVPTHVLSGSEPRTWKHETQYTKIWDTSNTNIWDTRNTKILDTRNSINVQVLSEMNIKDNQKPLILGKGRKCKLSCTWWKKDDCSIYLSSAFVLFLSISRPGVSNSIRPQFWCQKIKSTRLFGLFLPP